MFFLDFDRRFDRRFGSRFDISAPALTFWLALWCFGLRFDVSFRLVLGNFGLRLDVFGSSWKKSNFSIIQTFYNYFSRVTAPFTGSVIGGNTIYWSWSATWLKIFLKDQRYIVCLTRKSSTRENSCSHSQSLLLHVWDAGFSEANEVKTWMIPVEKRSVFACIKIKMISAKGPNESQVTIRNIVMWTDSDWERCKFNFGGYIQFVFADLWENGLVSLNFKFILVQLHKIFVPLKCESCLRNRKLLRIIFQN